GVLEQRGPGEHLPRAAHEQLEEREAFGAQFDRRTGPGDLAGGGIEFEVADGEPDRTLLDLPADEGPEPGREFLERERLREVVVGAGIEAIDPVLHTIPGGEEENGSPPS